MAILSLNTEFSNRALPSQQQLKMHERLQEIMIRQTEMQRDLNKELNKACCPTCEVAAA